MGPGVKGVEGRGGRGEKEGWLNLRAEGHALIILTADIWKEDDYLCKKHTFANNSVLVPETADGQESIKMTCPFACSLKNKQLWRSPGRTVLTWGMPSSPPTPAGRAGLAGEHTSSLITGRPTHCSVLLGDCSPGDSPSHQQQQHYTDGRSWLLRNQTFVGVLFWKCLKTTHVQTV